MKSFLAGALVATVISAGVTYAVASTSSETITACAHKKTGDLRMMTGKKCKKSERAVSWSAGAAQATQGVAGPKGDPGSQGEAGSNGISQVYYKSFSSGYLGGVSPYTGMGLMTLPAGTFVITANYQISPSFVPNGSETDLAAVPPNPDVTCRVKPTAEDIPALQSLSGRATNVGEIITFQNYVVLTQETIIEFECKSDASVEVGLSGNIFAFAVANVAPYSPIDPCPLAVEDAVSTAC